MPPAILIIEDDAIIQGLWHRLLTPQGYTIMQCSTPESARQLLTQYIPDLIILDYLFNDAPLGQFFLRTLTTMQQTPVIIHSGVADLVAGDESYFSEHKTHYLTKPCATDLMLQAVTNALTKVAR